MNEETVDCPPMGMWSEVACLLEDWAPPQDWKQVEVTPEAVGVALDVVSRSFEKRSAREAAGTVGWLLLTVLKKVYRGDPRNGGTRTRVADFSRFPEERSGIVARGGTRTPSCRLLWMP